MERTDSVQPDTIVPTPAIAMGEASNLEFRQTGGLEKEDIVILVLSAILVVATVWLAAAVL
jgi:hypothetical protein